MYELITDLLDYFGYLIILIILLSFIRDLIQQQNGKQ